MPTAPGLFRFTLMSGRMLAGVLALAFAMPASARDDALYSAAQAEQTALLATLKQLVSFDSGTLNGEGVRKVADIAEAQLKSLGLATERIDAKPSAGVNLVGRLAGTGKKKLLLIAHMDTVYLDGMAVKHPFHVEGDRAYGAGIADDKAGIAVVLHTMKLLASADFTAGSANFARITVLFNADEERGSPGSRELIKSLAGDHDAVLSFESTGVEQETIRTGTSGVTRVTVSPRA